MDNPELSPETATNAASTPSGDRPVDEPASILGITLVHGTFARGAAWCRPDSILCRTLRRRLGDLGYEVEIDVYEWSGENSHTARLEGGAGLREHLWRHLDSIDEAVDFGKDGGESPDPDCPRPRTVGTEKVGHFIIGHSHGGNVALYALRDDELCRRIDGVVTMGTPFIHCRPRALGPAIANLKTISPATVSLLGVLVGVPLIMVFAEELVIEGFENAPIYATLGIFLVFLLAILRRKWWIERVEDAVELGLGPWAEERQQACLEKLSTPGFVVPPLLCCRVTRDEAGSWLAGLQSVAGSPHRLYAYILDVAKVYVPMSFVVISTTGLLEHQFMGVLAEAVGKDLVILGTLYVLGIPFLLAFLALFPRILRGHGLGFGGEGLTDNLLVDIRAETLPQGAMRVMPADYRTLGSSLFGRHSGFYEDGAVLERISEWLAREPEARERETPERAELERTSADGWKGVIRAVVVFLVFFAVWVGIRFDLYSAAAHLGRSPVPWQELYPDLATKVVVDDWILQTREYRLEEPFAFDLQVPEAAACSLLGPIEPAEDDGVVVEIRLLGGAEKKELLWRSPEAPYLHLDIPLLPGKVHSVRFLPASGASVFAARLGLVCWSEEPEDPPTLYRLLF